MKFRKHIGKLIYWRGGIGNGPIGIKIQKQKQTHNLTGKPNANFYRMKSSTRGFQCQDS